MKVYSHFIYLRLICNFPPSKNSSLLEIEQYQSFELSKDLNPVIVKGMMGIILEIREADKTFEAEFPQEDGRNYEYQGKSSFTISSDYILQESPAV